MKVDETAAAAAAAVDGDDAAVDAGERADVIAVAAGKLEEVEDGKQPWKAQNRCLSAAALCPQQF